MRELLRTVRERKSMRRAARNIAALNFTLVYASLMPARFLELFRFEKEHLDLIVWMQ